MFLILITAGAVLTIASTALVLAFAMRFVVGEWPRYSSALKAALTAYLVPLIALLLAYYYAGRSLMYAISLPHSARLAIDLLILVLLLAWACRTFCKVADGGRIGWRHAFVTAGVTALIINGAGWLAGEHLMSSRLIPARTRTRTADGRSPSSPGSELCLRNLSIVLSDTGGGPKVHEAQAYRLRVEQEAKGKGVGLDDVLKAQLGTLGSQWPVASGLRALEVTAQDLGTAAGLLVPSKREGQSELANY